MARTTVVWITALLITASLTREAWAFGFTVDPVRVEVSIPAGKRRGKTVSASNLTDRPIHLKLYVRDVITLPDGSNDFPNPGSTEWSCANWVQFVPAELDLPPGETRDVRVSTSVPPEAQGGHYAMLFFETGPSYVEKGIGVNFRIGTLIDVVVPGTQRYQTRLAGFEFAQPKSVRLTLFNEGNVLIRPKGRLKVFNTNKARVAQVEFNPKRVAVLPKTLREITQELDAPLPPGSYYLRAEIDYGARTILVGELPIQVR